MFNEVGDFWANSPGAEAYPYAGKSTVNRGSGSGESNTPEPTDVRDLQLHPPETDHLTVAEFLVPFDGVYSVSDLAARRVYKQGEISTYRVFDDSKNQITSLTASNDRAWVKDENKYELGSLSAGDRIYFSVDKGEDDNYYYDATEIAWKVTAKGSATGLDDSRDGQSMNYFLEQNYPNPFNSDTIIQFNIANSDVVTLSIYDVMGQRIRTLVDGNLNAGNYWVSWNGKNDIGNSLPSGIYFSRIDTGNYANVKRMILLK